MTAIAEIALGRPLSPGVPPAKPEWREIGGRFLLPPAAFLPPEAAYILVGESPEDLQAKVTHAQVVPSGPRPLARDEMVLTEAVRNVSVGRLMGTAIGGRTLLNLWSAAPAEVRNVLVGRLPQAAPMDVPSIFSHSELREVMAPDVEEYARHARIYVWLKVAKTTVYETLPSLRGMTLELLKDPEGEEADSSICFYLSVGESPERMLQLDETLQNALYDRLPAGIRHHFSFVYDLA